MTSGLHASDTSKMTASKLSGWHDWAPTLPGDNPRTADDRPLSEELLLGGFKARRVQISDVMYSTLHLAARDLLLNVFCA